MFDPVEKLRQWIEGSNNIVFFGGAGVSTESGIPDFRSVDGLYNQKYKYPPETIISHSFFKQNPEEFYRFYRDKLIIQGAKPNQAHLRLAQLEQEAGSKNVLELHGSTLRNYCEKCGKKYGVEAVSKSSGVPKCACGGTIRPDVVLYEEVLDSKIIQKSVQAIAKADVLIVGGTSLVVYPAAGLINYYSGDKLVLINKSPTSYDSKANLLICDKIGEVFSRV